MTMSGFPVFFLDLQTTGARPENSHILEIAWGSADTINTSLVALPEGEEIPYRIQSLTGITDEDLRDALPLPEILTQLNDFIRPLAQEGKRPVAIIHYAQFEMPFLLHAYENQIPFDVICTHEVAKRLMPNLPSRGIKGLAGYFGYNAGELKRGQSHVNATKTIWQGLSKILVEKNISNLSELRDWLATTPKSARTKYEYPLPKEKRLSLPDQPGVYRMISQWGEVLYVGKATSLHSRVNSYFRGQKNRDPRKLEMLTQTWDLQVTTCGSPLEAALLETDEIKRLNPRYNISLKTGHRSLVFYNRDFTSMSTQQDEEHFLGPFPNTMVFDSMLKLAESLRQSELDPHIFYEELEPDLLKEGFESFCNRHNFSYKTFSSMRNILAVGLWWQRQEVEEELPEDEDLSEEEDSEEITLTPEDIADKFERHFMRAGRAYARARKITALLNSDIQFQMVPSIGWSYLILRQGKLQRVSDLDHSEGKLKWKDLFVDTYDRMSILLSELQKIRCQKGEVLITHH